MMRAAEMFFIIITLLTTTQGLLRSCFYYCKLLPGHSSISRPECDCSLRIQRKTRSINPANLHIATSSKFDDSGIYYEPAKDNSARLLSFDERTLEPLNLTTDYISKSGSNSLKHYHDRKKYINTSHSEHENKYNQHTSQKYKLGDREKPIDHQLHLYLDINSHSNMSHLYELKHMFEIFQTAEKNLTDCINLHIYIFPKYIDINSKINTNWDPKAYQDNFTNTQDLTEIQNICDQPISIIKQSIYEIKQSYPEKGKSAELAQNEEDVILYNADTSIQVDEISSTRTKVIAQTITNEFRADNNTTRSSQLINHVVNNVTTVKPNNMNSDKNITEHDAALLLNYTDHFVKINNITSTLPIDNKESPLKTTETVDTAELIDNYSIIASETNRSVYPEEEIEITSIITKELSNGTVISVVEDREELPNSDFIISRMSKSTDENTFSYIRDDFNDSTPTSDFAMTSTDKSVESDLVEIQGNIYFLFEDKHIPARFIQQPDGKLNVAIDGYSLCDQMQEENNTNFMVFLCNCIQLKKCTYPPKIH